MATAANTTPPDNDESLEIVYTELNLEKWSIWEPSSSKKPPRARIIERQRLLPDGSTVAAKVEIGFTQHGNLSTRDQKIYYVLCKLWEDAGRPATPVAFSLQRIARELGEEWGSIVCRSITRSLIQLRGVLFVWENSYFDKVGGEHIDLLDTFNILSELSIARRTKKLHATTPMCVFQFHREILKNLQANHTTPLFLATVLSFKSEIAQILYPRLDLLLADKKHYERRTKELFAELGLDGETYRHRSARKRVIERALEELRGAPLTTGCIVAATVEPTKDGSDFKIVIAKGPRRRLLSAAPAQALGASVPTASVPTMIVTSGRPALPEETPEAALVGYFHRQFHGSVPKGPLNPKELVSAARLIQQHGIPKAKALVDFAFGEAPKTNYRPASLNGILQYEGRFEAEQDERERERTTRTARQTQRQRAQEAQEARQREIVAALKDKVALVKNEAPQAFSAFLRYVESQRTAFLNTPIARQAKPETRELLSRTYAGSAKRLELFIGYFCVGSEGEAFLSMYPACKAISRWLSQNGDELRFVVEAAGETPEFVQLLE